MVNDNHYDKKNKPASTITPPPLHPHDAILKSCVIVMLSNINTSYFVRKTLIRLEQETQLKNKKKESMERSPIPTGL